METTCPHCAQGIEIDPVTLMTLRGRQNFACPACSRAVPVPGAATGTRSHASAIVKKSAKDTKARMQPQPARGLNRNLLILGAAALLTLGGVVWFIASRRNGDVQKTTRNNGSETPVLVSQGSLWTYWDKGAPPMDWQTAGYDDREWKKGPATLGFGPQVATAVNGGSESARHTLYFRHSFHSVNPARLGILRLRVLRDDGMVIYLNGRELLRDNMPTGTILHDTKALANVTGRAESEWQLFTFDGGKLDEGANTLAVEVHQALKNSTDLQFALELTEDDTPPPAKPEVRFKGAERFTLSEKEFTRYTISVTNGDAYSMGLFAGALDLPPIGANKLASRTVVEFETEQGKRLQSFVGRRTQAPDDFWFALPSDSPLPSHLRLVFRDRRTEARHVSDPVLIPSSSR
jgi:hypothetical protein